MTVAIAVAAPAPVAVYRIAKGLRMSLGGVLSLCIVGLLAFAGYAFFSSGFGGDGPRVVLCLSALVFALLLAYAWLACLRSRIEVHTDRIVRVGAFRSREMRLDAIAGLRTRQVQHSRFLVFLPKDPRGKKLKIDLMMPRSKAFQAWARATFRDLDAEEREADLRQILANETLGADAEARGRKYRLAMRLARSVNGGAAAALLWAIFYPAPYAILIWILIGLPFAALAAAAPFPGLIRFFGPPKGAYPILYPALVAASGALALRSFLDRDILAWGGFWAPFCIASLLIFASILARFPELRKPFREALMPLALAAVYGYGATISLNCLQDGSVPREYRAAIERKRVSSGETASYYLELSPWGPRGKSAEVTVAPEVYAQVRAGDSVSVWTKSGALGIPWFMVTAD